jgi:hypothetical protein
VMRPWISTMVTWLTSRVVMVIGVGFGLPLSGFRLGGNGRGLGGASQWAD